MVRNPRGRETTPDILASWLTSESFPIIVEVALSNDGKSDCSVQRDNKAQGQIELRATSAEVKVKQSFTSCPLFSKLKGTCQLRNRHQIETHLGIVPVLSSVKDLSYCGKEGLFEETLGL